MGVLAAAVVLGSLAVAMALAPAGARPLAKPRVAARGRGLPVAVQSLISGRIGARDREFAARRVRSGYGVQGGGVRARLTRGGASVDGAASLALAGVGRGGRIEALGRSALTARADRVSYAYTGLTAWYRAGPLGVEQGFTVARRPAGPARRALTIALDLAGRLTPRLAGGGLAWFDRQGRTVLRYGGLAAVDATGRSLPAALALEHHRLLIRVRDAGARYPVRIDPLFQLGPKLTATDPVGIATFGFADALSGDGNTAVIAGAEDNGAVGAAWIFVRSGSSWTEQAKLVPSAADGQAHFGFSASISSDGNTVLIGADNDGGPGAAYVFVRSGTTWTQQYKTPSVGTGVGEFGFSVALSAAGNLAVVGAPTSTGAGGVADGGAMWTFVRSGSTWSQLGGELTPTGEVGGGYFGVSVAVSAVGTTALVGATQDNSSAGAAYLFTLDGSTWTQDAELTGTDEVGPAANFGDWVALSGDASTALIGGFSDNDAVGAVWAFSASSGWTRPVQKIVPSDETGGARFGTRVALSSNGTVAVIGGPIDDNQVGAAWIYTRNGSTWTQDGPKLTGGGEIGAGDFGFGVGLSADGSTALIGAPDDNGDDGAAWIFGAAPPTCSNVAGTTAVGGGTTTLGLLCSGPVGAPLTYAIVKGPAHGTLGPIDQGTGSVAYTPSRGYAGTDQFTYDATDADGASNVATATIAVPAAPLRLNPTIAYTFHASRAGTSFSALYLTGVPRAATVRVVCRGRHCPFGARAEHVPRRLVCHGTGRHRRCRREPPPRSGTVNLTRLFHHRELTVGTHLTIDVTETGAIGKVYMFTMRRSRAPALAVSCLAPGSEAPGRGC